MNLGRVSEAFWSSLATLGTPCAPRRAHCPPNARPKSSFEGILVDLSGGCLLGVSRGALRQGPLCNPHTQAQSKCSFQKTDFGTQRLHFGVTLGGFWEALGMILLPWRASWRFFPHFSAMFGLGGCSCRYVGFWWIWGAGRGGRGGGATAVEV